MLYLMDINKEVVIDWSTFYIATYHWHLFLKLTFCSPWRW